MGKLFMCNLPNSGGRSYQFTATSHEDAVMTFIEMVQNSVIEVACFEDGVKYEIDPTAIETDSNGDPIINDEPIVRYYKENRR
jgi:hypothetical protein